MPYSFKFRASTRLSAALAVLVTASSYSTVAWGFCRITNCSTKDGATCPTDAHGCGTTGDAVSWKDGKVELVVDQAGSAASDLSGEDTEAAVQAALHTWSSAHCPGGGHPSISASTKPGSHLNVEFAETGKNQSVVLYRDDTWPYEAKAVAKTFLGFVNDEIADTDLAINTADYPYSLNPSGEEEIDLLAVLTHEIGHVLGLAHSDVAGATMQPEVKGFATADLESLEDDDVEGICAIYPPEKAMDDECPAVPNAPQSSMCALSRRSAPASPGAIVPACLVGLLWLGRRLTPRSR